MLVAFFLVQRYTVQHCRNDEIGKREASDALLGNPYSTKERGRTLRCLNGRLPL